MPRCRARAGRQIFRSTRTAAENNIPAAVGAAHRHPRQPRFSDEHAEKVTGHRCVSNGGAGDHADDYAGAVRYAAGTDGCGAREPGTDYAAGELFWVAGAVAERSGTVRLAVRRIGAAHE